MDLEVQERTRAHYDRHAPADANSRQGMEERQSGLAFPLKHFHNEVKRQLLYRFARDKPRLLDLACGRGGDLHKWVGAGVRYVKGLDLSPNEVDEARRRYQELLTRKPNLQQRFRAEFEPSDILGMRDWIDEPGAPKYDVATCMFAIHYFFVTEAGLKQFMRNVSLNLKIGGHFVGTCPDGKQVMSAIHQAGEKAEVFKSPALILRKLWHGKPACFGSCFKCAISDTVTQGLDEEGGSEEFLVFWNVLKALAQEVGLTPISEYNDDLLDSSFLKGDRKHPFKHFNPRFERSHPSLETASALNVAFVFQKTSEPEGISAARMQKRKAEDESLDDAEGEQPAKRQKQADQNGLAPPPSSADSEQAAPPSSAPQDSKQQAAGVQNNSEGSPPQHSKQQGPADQKNSECDLPEEPDEAHEPCSPASHQAGIDNLGWTLCSRPPLTIAPVPPDFNWSHTSTSSTGAEASETCHTGQSLVMSPQESSAAANRCLVQTLHICPGALAHPTPAPDLLQSAADDDPEKAARLSSLLQATSALPSQVHSGVHAQLAISVAT